MLSGRLFRCIHTNSSLWQTAASSNKTLLAELRKKTGYTYSNCRKALQMHGNDINKAEQWLADQAQTMGWIKATKLEGRTTGQGLIAVLINQNQAALVEVNCETDFVARNKIFRSFVNTVASTALNSVSNTLTGNDLINKVNLDTVALKELPTQDGKSLADHSALVIGNVGENLCIRRALCVNVNQGVFLAGYSHPAPTSESADLVGKYAALVALKAPNNVENLGRKLCQHIIGMNPAKIGCKDVDKPNPVSDDETTMIFQDYLLDPSITVEQLLNENQVEVLDFARFELGESVPDGQNLDTIETCG